MNPAHLVGACIVAAWFGVYVALDVFRARILRTHRRGDTQTGPVPPRIRPTQPGTPHPRVNGPGTPTQGAHNGAQGASWRREPTPHGYQCECGDDTLEHQHLTGPCRAPGCDCPGYTPPTTGLWDLEHQAMAAAIARTHVEPTDPTGQPAFAVIEVNDGDHGKAWPLVSRVGGGWQSGAHHYPDTDVLSVQPLRLVPG